MEGAAAFNLEQLSLMHRSLQRSEALVGRSFCIPALPSKQYPYEVVTAVDLSAPERATEAFAHLVVYERQRASGPEQLYRICLQDETILARAAAGGAPWLGSLLVYILTHELVHVVRFQRAEQSFVAKPRARQREEDRVHQLTLELLARAQEPHLEQLNELYGNPVIPARRVQR